MSSYMTFYPVHIPTACTISGMGIVPLVAGYVFYLAMYSDNPAATSGGPAVRLTGGSLSGAGSNTPQMCPVNWTFTAPTDIWVHIGCNGAPTLTSHINAPVNMFAQAPSLGFNGGGGANVYPHGKYTTAQGPSSVVGDVQSTTMSSITNDMGPMPLFLFTVA